MFYQEALYICAVNKKTTLTMLELKSRYSAKELYSFAAQIEAIQAQIDFKVSARGWCYLLETSRLINKDQFGKVEDLINQCRRKGILPVDFIAEEKSREFSGIENPSHGNPEQTMQRFIEAAMNAGAYFTPNWWAGEGYYIQMVVEKIDLVTLFETVTKEYKIPIANAKGWSSILQRAEYARRFKEAEENGLQCVLLYCGDHDPDGLRIGDFIRANLEQVKQIMWEDGESGYDPENLIVDRFGLNKAFIDQHGLTWIDNLITGSGKNLADKHHKNYNLPYLQTYLKDIGERKVEANAIVTIPDEARRLCANAIEKYLGPDAPTRFRAKRQAVKDRISAFIERTGLQSSFDRALRIIDEECNTDNYNDEDHADDN